MGVVKRNHIIWLNHSGQFLIWHSKKVSMQILLKLHCQTRHNFQRAHSGTTLAQGLANNALEPDVDFNPPVELDNLPHQPISINPFAATSDGILRLVSFYNNFMIVISNGVKVCCDLVYK
jgi:hypothetical protein